LSTLLGNDGEVFAVLGKRSSHDESEHPYLDHVGRDSFYGFLASHRAELFHDEDFTGLYCSDNGRPSVPPSLLATALLLQAHEGVSDEEAKARADFDLRWKAALGIGLEERPFAKSTLQLFRARLIIHERVRTLFERSLAFARRTGYFRSRKIKVVLDTSYILGRGAAKDTYNLLGDGVRKLVGALAASADREPEGWADEHGLARYYFGSSLKGEAEIDWDDAQAREAFLQSVVADADRLLGTARAALERIPAGDPGRGRLREAAILLERLLSQDIERREDGGCLKQAVSGDRIVSVHDPEMRHGRKSASKRFDGHKAQVAVDPESQLRSRRRTSWRATHPTTSGRWRWSSRWRRTPASRSRRRWETAPTETATPDGPSPRPGGNWWPRWPAGAEGPSSPKKTSGSIWRR
jgi:hypothetical protein